MPDRVSLCSPTRPRAPKLMLLLIACVFAAHATAEEPKSGPSPTTPAAKGGTTTATVPPSAAPGAPAAGEPGATGPAAAATAADADCDRYVGALQGRGDPSLLGKPEVQSLATSASDLIMCRAVLNDSDAVCSQLMGVDRGPTMACRQTVAIYRELRRHPDTHAFMFTESDAQEC